MDYPRMQTPNSIILQELDSKSDQLLMKLWRKGAINLEQVINIAACDTRQASAELLLAILQEAGEDLNDVFKEALNETDQGHIVFNLEMSKFS